MRAIQRILNQVSAQLNRLPTNARLLIGSMMVILLMALMLVSQYAGGSTMAPLGLTTVSANVKAEAALFLDMRQITYEDRGGDIYVPADQRFSVLGQLNEQNIVAADEINFNSLIDRSSNPFIGREQQRQMWLTAKMNVLSSMISARGDVARAQVLISEPVGSMGFGRSYVGPTATVSADMRGTSMNQDIADAIGRTVSGAHAGLKPESVTITDNQSGHSFVPRGMDTMLSGDYLEKKQKTEEYYTRRIANAMAHVPGVTVTVNSVIRNTREQRTTRTVEDPKIGPKSTENRDYSATNTARSGEAGVRPNAGQSIGGTGQGSQVTESTSREQVDSEFGHENAVVIDQTGYPIQVNAVVGIPRSFFVQIFREQAQDPDVDPDATQLAAIVQTELTRWESFLEPLVRTDGNNGAVPGSVKVDMIHDFSFTTASDSSAVIAGAGGLGDIIGGGLVQNIGLGALAVVSLLMMFLMVKRAGVREELPTAAELVGLPPALQTEEEDIVGEAEEGQTPLEGMELDEETTRSTQLLQQIEEMVSGNTEEAATLLKRWIGAHE